MARNTLSSSSSPCCHGVRSSCSCIIHRNELRWLTANMFAPGLQIASRTRRPNTTRSRWLPCWWQNSHTRLRSSGSTGGTWPQSKASGWRVPGVMGRNNSTFQPAFTMARNPSVTPRSLDGTMRGCGNLCGRCLRRLIASSGVRRGQGKCKALAKGKRTSPHRRAVGTNWFLITDQQAGKGSKRSAPCQLEKRCQLHPKRSRVRRA